LGHNNDHIEFDTFGTLPSTMLVLRKYPRSLFYEIKLMRAGWCPRACWAPWLATSSPPGWDGVCARGGHIDGDAIENQHSISRANAMRDYLVMRGVHQPSRAAAATSPGRPRAISCA
jgi:hypothetical protein